MKSYLSKEEIGVKFAIPDFRLKTQRQIAKDFACSGYSFDADFESEDLSIEAIVDAVQEKLAEALRSGEQQTLQLLYQIDINQQKFLELTTDPHILMKLSELIVRREAYKVYLRSIF